MIKKKVAVKKASEKAPEPKLEPKKPTEEVSEELGFRPLVNPTSKFQPVKQTYNGFEIEKRWLILTKEEDFSKRKNGVLIYDEILEKGTPIEQGYIKDIEKAKAMLDELGIELEFQPNTIRLRKYGKDYILTLKDRKTDKKREAEWELNVKQFKKYWPWTEGARITKRRMIKKVKGHMMEFDAFTDRYLVIIECEVQREGDLAVLPSQGMDITGNQAFTNKAMAR